MRVLEHCTGLGVERFGIRAKCKFQVSLNDIEDVVEVMCDAARQFAEGPQSLAVVKLCGKAPGAACGFHDFGHVAKDAAVAGKIPVRVQDGVPRNPHFRDLPGRAFHGDLKIAEVSLGPHFEQERGGARGEYLLQPFGRAPEKRRVGQGRLLA